MLNSCTAILKQAIDLLDGLTPNEYQKQLPPHFPSSIGVHMRHISDHFFAIMNGSDKSHIDYNKRNRYSDLELYPELAIESFEEVIVWLSKLQEDVLDSPLTVTTEVDVNRPHSSTCQSTLVREIVFASSHAIHHYALVRIMCSMQNKSTHVFFGYAPATITNINKTA